MGDWGIKAFQNDSALDWAYELEDSDGLDAFYQALKCKSTYIEEHKGSEIIAACEILALLNGKSIEKESTPQAIIAWIKKNKTLKTKELIPLAIEALNKVMGEASEIYERRQGTEHFKAWRADVDYMRRYLRA